jgi:hypothetical protein
MHTETSWLVLSTDAEYYRQALRMPIVRQAELSKLQMVARR